MLRNNTSPRTLVLLAPAAALALAASAHAQVITTLVKAGDVIPGVGTVTGVDGYAVNNAGEWVVDADTNNPDLNIDRVLIRTGVQYWREDDVFTGSLRISSWDDLSLNNVGDLGGNLFLRPTGPNDSSVYINKSPVIQEGFISTASGFSPNTPYIGFFGAKINDNRDGVVVASVDDPAIATTVDRAIVGFRTTIAGGLTNEFVIAKEGDLLPGATLPVADIETDSHEFDIAHNGDVLYGVDFTGTVLDGAIYRYNASLNTNQLVAIEGGASPVAGRTWANLANPELSLSGNGLHIAYSGQLSGDTATDAVIVRNGVVFKQEGDTVPGLTPFKFQSFGSAPVLVDDSGNIVWYGDWDDPDTTRDTGIFYNDTLLVQEGVTKIDGLTVVTVRSFADTLTLSDNGQYVLFEAVLEGGIEGAFLITIPEPASAGALALAGVAALRRRRRG
jgi:hypothetical protein